MSRCGGPLPAHVWVAGETKYGRKARVCPVCELGGAEEPGGGGAFVCSDPGWH